jgi:hypothetical protein
MRARSATASLLCSLFVGSMIAPAGANSAIPASILEGLTTREITLPAGTRLPVILETPVSSSASRVEQSVSGHVSRDVSMSGQVVVPAGSQVYGVVTDARRSGKVKGLAHVAIRFTELVLKGSSERYRIQTAAIGRTAPATKTKDAAEIGAPAAGGAIVGAIVGGKKGALIGTAVGGGVGTAVVLSTSGQEVGIGRGAVLVLRLGSPVVVRVKR